MSTNPPAPEPSGSQPAYQPPAPGNAVPPPPVAPQYGQPAAYAAAPASGPYDSPTPAKRSQTLGLIAFLASLAAVVIGAILAYLAGLQLGGLAQYGTYAPDGSYSFDPEVAPGAQSDAEASAGLTIAGFSVFGVLALWGFIQGIIATVQNRGRGWGIAAIVLAVIGGGIVGVIYTVGLGVGAAPYITG